MAPALGATQAAASWAGQRMRTWRQAAMRCLYSSRSSTLRSFSALSCTSRATFSASAARICACFSARRFARSCRRICAPDRFCHNLASCQAEILLHRILVQEWELHHCSGTLIMLGEMWNAFADVRWPLGKRSARQDCAVSERKQKPHLRLAFDIDVSRVCKYMRGPCRSLIPKVNHGGACPVLAGRLPSKQGLYVCICLALKRGTGRLRLPAGSSRSGECEASQEIILFLCWRCCCCFLCGS